VLQVSALQVKGLHTKWEILVQKLLKSVELFKSYGLFGEPKVVDFLFFGKMITLLKEYPRRASSNGHTIHIQL
jgi:hypothetical protein